MEGNQCILFKGNQAFLRNIDRSRPELSPHLFSSTCIYTEHYNHSKPTTQFLRLDACLEVERFKRMPLWQKQLPTLIAFTNFIKNCCPICKLHTYLISHFIHLRYPKSDSTNCYYFTMVIFGMNFDFITCTEIQKKGSLNPLVRILYQTKV